jgi:hypothetical protein
MFINNKTALKMLLTCFGYNTLYRPITTFTGGRCGGGRTTFSSGWRGHVINLCVRPWISTQDFCVALRRRRRRRRLQHQEPILDIENGRDLRRRAAAAAFFSVQMALLRKASFLCALLLKCHRDRLLSTVCCCCAILQSHFS